ncbi:MAG: hypothetical protein KKH01_10235 [Firmicutes bacterium]|nr:hypothetical protein [Bacillota bacterium]
MNEKLTFSNIIGKMLLVGITRKNNEGKFIAYEQHHGKICYADEHKGITIRNPQGKEFTIPPQLSNIHVAEPGIYEEETTGIIIENPDFISSWIINEPQK